MVNLNGRIGSYPKLELHSLREITEESHYKNLRAHCLREGTKYKNINYLLVKLIDNPRKVGSGKVWHLTFDTAYEYEREPLSEKAEEVYRESLLSMAVERVLLEMVDASKVYVATVVGRENVTGTGEKYEMYPTLHVLLDGAVPEKQLLDFLTKLYFYMADHGYEVVGTKRK